MTKRKRWMPEEDARLVVLYPVTLTADLLPVFGCESVSQIHCRARVLGIKKNAEFLASPKAGRFDGKRGTATRFAPGASPWSKGKQLGTRGRSGDTQFKRGQKPHTWQPVGTIRLASCGYLQKKMTDTGYPPRDWVMLHRLVWEEAHGPIPKGLVVAFKDKNRQNVALENLELVTRSDLAKRNSIHDWPEELKTAIRTVGALTRQINKMQKEASANG